jgi:hypothetical protein
MKSIKNQYIALKEGKMTEAQFMRNVKMTLPQYISNVTLFKQAERILINKGIISEALISSKVEQLANKVIKWYENHPNPKMKERISSVESTLEKLMSKTVGKDSINYEDFEKTVKSKFNLPFEDPNYSVFKNSLKEESNEIETVQDEKGNFTRRVKLSDKDKKTVKKIQALMAKEKSLKEGINSKYNYFAVDKSNGKILNGWEYKNLDKESILEYAHMDMADMDYKKSEYKIVSLKYFKDKNINPFDSNNWKKINESLNEAKDTSTTGYYNQDGKEQYGKFDELDNMNAQEIMAGYVMEKQDNPDIDKKEAVKLVIKNLKKDQFYYTNYKLTGVRDLQPTEFTTTKRKPFFDEMEEVNKNGDNFVDEKNKMQVVKESKKNKMKTQINEVKRMRQLAGLITESQLIKEDKLEDIKSLLSDETLRNSDIGYSSGDEVSITYKNSKKLPFEDFSKLEDEYIIYKDELSDEPYRVQYFIGDKSTKTPSKPKPSYDDEDVFENYNNKQNTIKPDTKNKLKEMVRKMMKEMFDGRDNLTDIE